MFSIKEARFLKILGSNKYATLDWKLITKNIKNNCAKKEYGLGQILVLLGVVPGAAGVVPSTAWVVPRIAWDRSW